LAGLVFVKELEMRRPIGIAAMVAIVTVIGAQAAFGQAQDLRCDYKRKIECSASGCEETSIGSQYLLLARLESLRSSTLRSGGVVRLPTIRRCDAKGCSPVVVRATLSGAFTNISSDGGGYFLKFASVDLGDLGPPVGDFVEVESQLLSTITYFGSCPVVTR
jgi:hypothetical protein